MKHSSRKAKRQTNSGLWIGGAILLTLTLILGTKMLRQPAQPVEATTKGVAPPTLAIIPEPNKSAVEVDAGPLPTAALNEDDDPYPTDPTAQVEWILRNNKPAMVLFHSRTCIPCKAMEKLVAQVRDDYEPNIAFIDVVTDERANRALVRQAGIQAIPTTFFFTGDGQGSRTVGALQEDALRSVLDGLLVEVP